MRATANKKLNLLDAEDFVNREVLNENTEKIDEVLKTLEEPEHDTTKQTEVEELESGESLKVALRKLAKAVADYISHKADKVAHITAEERTAWNAKLGVEKIAANLTTDTDGMVLAAAMGKNLKEQIDTNANAISTLNSNLNKYYYVEANSSVEISVRNPEVQGNFGILYAHHTIPAYKAACFFSTGNGNNTNAGQKATLIPILESNSIVFEVGSESGKYNNIIVTNNSPYGLYIRRILLATATT